MAHEDNPAEGEIQSNHYDVIIVGASFAGLAAAMQLRGKRVLLIDQRPIGTHQTSTCAMPLATAQAVGGSCAIQDTHRAAAIHTGGREIPYTLTEPYVTVDYYTFCQAMLAQTDAEVWLARVTHNEKGVVTTTRGSASARFVIDASGWQSLARESPARNIPLLGYGMETEIKTRLPLTPGLHFYYEKRVARNGYGWVFPCGSSVRVGVCSFDKGVRLGPVLDSFLAGFGLKRGTTHGGPMAIGLRRPLEGEVFVVGDAAGQCMPLWAEGIRSAIYFASECGQAIADALNGIISDDFARSRYETLVRDKEGFHRMMWHLQGIVARLPERLRRAILGVVAWPPIAHRFMDIYLHASGWLQAPLKSSTFKVQGSTKASPFET